MIHPNTEIKFISPTVGYGVFANQRIPKGSITYAKDSLEIEISPEQYRQHNKAMQAAIERFSYTDERGYRVVSWDFAKYVNHCCACNSISTGYGFEIALRDIEVGEQITDEYGIFNLEEEMDVFCDLTICRKRIGPKDFDALYPEWDAKIKDAFSHFLDVDQPLLDFVPEETKSDLMAYLQHKSHYRSVYTLKHHA